MWKGAVAVVATAIVVGIGSAIIFFDTDNKWPDSGDEIDITQECSAPDSCDEVDANEPEWPDSGDDYDTSTSCSAPDSCDDEQEPTSPDSGDEIDPNEPTSPDSGDEITLNEDLKNRAKWSCNVIDEGSTCIEYIGAYRTTKIAKLNCSDSGKFSSSPCPRPVLWWCRVGIESPTEIVTWHYSYGWDPYTEVKQYAAKACNALPGYAWVE